MSHRFLLRFIFLSSLVIFVITSCADKPTTLLTDNSESVVLDKNVQLCQASVFSFFDKLGIESYDECLVFFSDSLLISPGKEKIIEALKSRNVQNGIVDSIQIYYISKNDSLYTFNIRCFNDASVANQSYEKIGVQIVGKKPEFVSYDYSKMQYCDLQMANDTSSEIHQYLMDVYNSLTFKDADAVYNLLDPQVVEGLKIDKYKEIYAERKVLFTSESSIVIKSVWPEISRGIPVLNFIIESSCADSKKYIDEIMISDRIGKYYLGKIDRQLKTESIVQQLSRPTDNELKPFANEAAYFYNLLVENKTEQIVERIDKIVFVNNDYNAVKNSFNARNQYYGKPTSLKNTNVKAYTVDGNTVVDFNFSVENSSGKKSYEKVSVIRKENSKFFIYGYDYRDQPF